MIRISRFFENLFDDEKISVPELLNFSSDHIERIRANDPTGVFGEILAQTEARHNALESAVNALGTDTAQREGRTKDMNEVVADFKKKVSRVEGLIKFTYGLQSGTYQEFYPRGITEYTNMTIEDAEILIKRFSTAVDNHVAELPAAVVTEFQQLLLDYQAARQVQQKEKGEVGGSRDEVHTAQTALQLQLSVNVLTIALKFSNQPEKAAVYFDQSLLNDASGQPFSRISGTVDGNTIAGIEYDSELVSNETLITFRNQSSNTTLEFYFAASAGDEPGALKVQVGPDSEQIISAADIGFDSNNVVLQVKNLDPVAADWEVEIPE